MFVIAIKNLFRMSTQRHKQVLLLKSKRISEIMEAMYVPQKNLKPIQFDMNNIVPNFFTSKLFGYENSLKVSYKQNHNAPSNSFIKLEMKLSTDQKLKSGIARLNQNRLRIGRILEIMDSLAGIVAYRHCNQNIQNKNSITMVTGCVDKIIIEDDMNTEHDISFFANINYLGKTTAEIEVNLLQNNLLKASAFFTMVGRKPLNHLNLGIQLIRLDYTHQQDQQKCKFRFTRAENNKLSRTRQISQSLDKTLPTLNQISHLHKFFMNRNIIQQNAIPISNTESNKQILMHIQDRNLHGKIFGGFLMRESLELAFFSCLKLSKGKTLRFQHIQDIYFLQPVQVGNGLLMKTKVVYTEGNFMVVKVQALKLKLNTLQTKKACQLFCIFSTNETQNLPEVIPKSYQQGIEYLVGKRKFDSLFVNDNNQYA